MALVHFVLCLNPRPPDGSIVYVEIFKIFLEFILIVVCTLYNDGLPNIRFRK